MSAWQEGAGPEQRRLSVVRGLGLLDTGPEERFDRITRLASRTLSVPYAIIGLLDERRLWFKSRIGFPDEQVPRDDSVCARAIEGVDDAVHVVEDLSLDPRFARLSSVQGPIRVRAYGGRVLRVRGEAVGTLCVLDDRARRFTDEERAALVDLGFWAEDELQAEDERRAARELALLKQRSEMVLAGVAEGVVGVGADGRAAFVNTAAGELLGWDAEELVGRDLHAVTHSRHADGTAFLAEDCPVAEVLRTGVAQRLLHGTFWRRDGRPLPVDWSVGGVMDDEGVRGAVVVFGDATERLRNERMKDEFVSVVSHELRTPLASLTGALRLLDAGVGGQLPERAAELVDLAARNGERLARLVDDILDVERSATGGMSLSRRRVSVAELGSAAAATVQVAAGARRITVDVDLPPGHVWGDEHRLVQVLVNLLGNALRFSADGSTIRLHGSRDASGVVLQVSDEGIGMPAEVLPKIFDRFWQAEAGARRSTGGTGLGLAIAKNIVELHGGRISADSTEGVGTTFSVRLPERHHVEDVDQERREQPAGVVRGVEQQEQESTVP